jgi:asparagine synthase (glutamine-hydrolysing)
MCGIAGILTQRLDTDEMIRRMVQSLHHRGPDDNGIHLARTLQLGSTRLAIIDLSPNGHMPMKNPETGDVLVFNGEIYNYRSLRHELEARGLKFRSESDTEVVLKAYEEWGVKSFERLHGMFAIGLWDERRAELVLARDRLGEKPLYYFMDDENRCLAFGSEVRALLASGAVPRRLDHESLGIYLFNGFAIAPQTLIRGVRSLLPGYWARIGPTGVIRHQHRYWRIPDFARDIRTNDEELREVLANAVKDRLISDVPLGAFLSGGLDSSTIVALMRRYSGDVRTFSLGFPETPYDERPHARWVADRFDTRHTEIRLGQNEFSAWLHDSLAAIDQPTFDGLNMYFVARAARESGLTVALSGLNADELFGGYPCFRSAPLVVGLVRLAPHLPISLANALIARMGGLSGARKALHVLAHPAPGLELLAAYQSCMALFPGRISGMLANPGVAEDSWLGLRSDFVAFLSGEAQGSDEMGQLSHYALRLFGGERTLRDGDGMSMATSLEVRTVFSDHRLIEALWRVPGRRRCAGAPNKRFEWQLVRPILGDDYPLRPKQGFNLPLNEWLQAKALRREVNETLLDPGLAARAGLNPASVASIAFSRGRLPWSRIWALFVLIDWVRRHRVSA